MTIVQAKGDGRADQGTGEQKKGDKEEPWFLGKRTNDNSKHGVAG